MSIPQLQIMLILIALFSFQAQAGVQNFFRTNFNQELSPSSDAEFNLDFSRIADGIDRYQLAPVSVSVLILPPSNNASFDEGHLIYIPQQLEFTNHFGLDPYTKERFHLRAVFAHEYAHAVFDSALSQAISFYAEMSKIRKNMSDIQMQMLLLKGTPAEVNEQKNNLRARYKELQDSVIQNSESMYMRRLILPYTEFFADVVAVYLSDDPSAIFDALYNPNWLPHQTNEIDYVRARDFSAQHNLADWKNDSEHGLFSPARSLLGKTECWPRTEVRKKENLQYILAVLLNEIQSKHLSRADVKISDNAALIEKFSALCRNSN